MSSYRCSSGLLWAAAALVACGGAQLSQTKVTESQAAMRAAEAVGAEQDPRAALHLKLARDQADQATRLAREGEEEQANLLLDRSRVDAELAAQLVRTSQEQRKAQQAWTRTEQLQGQNPQQTPR